MAPEESIIILSTSRTPTSGDEPTGSTWSVIPHKFVFYAGTKDDWPWMLKLKEAKQKHRKPQKVIGFSVPIQKRPYLDHRRNCARA